MKVLSRLREFCLGPLGWDLLAPALLYFGLGLTGVTSIANTFFVKEYLGLTAAFLSSVGFWVGIPWALKMPIGHLVDVMGRSKHLLVVLGVTLLEGSLWISLSLVRSEGVTTQLLDVNTWYLIGSLCAACGIVLQDVVADSLCVELGARESAEAKADADAGEDEAHTTVQTVARLATLCGALVAGWYNLSALAGSSAMTAAARLGLYETLFSWARLIPVLALLACGIALVRGIGDGVTTPDDSESPAHGAVLVFSALFVLFIGCVAAFVHNHREEVVFAGSLLLIGAAMWWLSRKIDPELRVTFLSVVVVVFLIRATPSVGAGLNWWEIDVLGFDEAFFARLILIGHGISIVSMIVYQRVFARRRLWMVYAGYVGITTVLSLPILGMYFGLHEWTAQMTHGVVNARMIAIVDTAIDSPLAQVAMLPALALTARCAPAGLRTAFFEVTASFLNIATAAAALGTRYLNEVFVVTREVVDVQGVVIIAADYSQLGTLIAVAIALGFLVPMCALIAMKVCRVKGW